MPKLLKQQVQRYLSNFSDHEMTRMQSFLDAVSATYAQQSDEKSQVEEALARMSDELQQINSSLRQKLDEQEQIEEELRITSSVFTHANEAVMILGPACNILKLNQAFLRLTGMQEEEAIGQGLDVLIADSEEDRETLLHFWSSLKKKGFWSGEMMAHRLNGEQFPIWLSISSVLDADGRVHRYVCMFMDISLQKESERRIQHLALYDALTGLPNRVLFHERLAHAMESARRKSGPMALMFVDLDHFKPINDTLGHQAGDALLQEMSRRLQDCVRKSDTVARLGGDEFTVVLESIRDPKDAERVACKVLDELRRPVLLGGMEVNVSGSIGISVFPEDGEDVDTLMRHADLAMYRAKNAGRSGFQFYAEELGELAEKRFNMEHALRQALLNNEFVLFYQPLLHAETRRLVGVEALVRWQHPERGLLPPAEFLLLAEENGLIVPLGSWVLQQACQDVASWCLRTGRNIRVSVNISSKQLTDEHFVSDVKSALRQNGLEANMLEIEITEGVMIQHFEHDVQVMKSLRNLGVSFAVDDFGVGYSSLNYLKSLPVNRLKIDRSFISGVPEDQNDVAIVSSIMAMGHQLGLSVVAEGVETDDQYGFLKHVRSDEVQGFLFARPMPASEIYHQLRADLI